MADLRNSAYNLWPPGHYYSPAPDLEQIKKNEQRIFLIPEELPGINLNCTHQKELFEQLVKYYGDMPFKDEKTNGLRYFYKNDFYSYGDAIILACMIRHLKPKRIIEVGSGFSSCVALDINEMFFNNTISCRFIEPFPERFLSLIKKDDLGPDSLIKKNLEDVDLNVFSSLSKGDILFIDGSHVSKVNSDVNYVLFKILPALNPGVFIHFHDIFYPFEYPKEWIYEGKFWNEAYLLRAFLQYNRSFNIEYFATYFYGKFSEKIKTEAPLIANNPGGNLWISKCDNPLA